MRIALTVLAVLVVTFGAFALARGDEAADTAVSPKAIKAMAAHVAALQAEVEFLRSREKALSTYVLMNEQRGRGLATVVSRTRAAGFEARTIPADSRKILMAGLLGAAQSIQKGLPRVSKDEATMLKEIAKLRKAAGLD